MTETICVGIDVAKASLEIALSAQGIVMTFPNTPEGHDQLASTLANYAQGNCCDKTALHCAG
uniref:hypothetical protein n=1 Tax=Photorhabdus viridis TaxID=3163327 RepID=UPI003307BEA1